MKYIPTPEPESINVSKSNPVIDFFILTAGLMVLLAAALFVLGLAAQNLSARIPLSWERKIFASGAWIPKSWDAKGKTEKALNRVGEKLHRAENSELPPYDIRLICEESPNAFAVPGGFILITSGLLKLIHTENGLAFVIGHEMGHFHNRDHLKSLGRSLVFVSLGALFGISGDEGVFSPLSGLVENTFNRDQERAADAYSLNLIKTAYGHTAGADEFFEGLAKKETSVWDKVPTLLKTHPGTPERMAEIKRAAQAQGPPKKLLPLLSSPSLCP